MTARIFYRIGQLLVVGGLALAMFLAYEYWVTDLLSDHAQDDVAQQLRQEWTQPDPTVVPPAASPAAPVGGSATSGEASRAAPAPSGRSAEDPTVSVPTAPPMVGSSPTGQAFSFLHIPRLGPRWSRA